MKTNRKIKKARSYAFGMNQMEGIGGAVDALGEGIKAGMDSDPYSYSKGEVAVDSFKAGNKGAVAGFSIGGGWGALAGGILGQGLGLFTGIRKRKMMKELQRKRESVEATKRGLNNAATYEQEYAEDNPLAYTFANGGILPNVAYVDNNEVIRDDYGNISQVPNTKAGTDNHLIDSSELDSVLSDKLKVPGTKETFAQKGKKLTKMSKPSKGKDRFAENSNKLNMMNANAMYNDLLRQQEAVKIKKGIKPKYKGVPAYAYGKDDDEIGIRRNNWTGIKYTSPFYDTTYSHTSEYPEYSYLDNGGITPAGRFDWIGNNFNNKNSKESNVKYLSTLTKNTKKPGVKKERKVYDTASLIPENINRVHAKELMQDPKKSVLETPVKRIENNAWLQRQINEGMDEQGFDVSNLGALAPVLYNFAQGLKKPEVENPVLNPYLGAINRAMTRRRMNIEPVLAANRKARAIANYNAANMNPNTGMNLAYRTQAASDEYNKNADLYASRDNTNNAYLGEYANMLNNLGQQYVQNQVMTNDLNARNRAAVRNFRSKAAGQISDWSQNEKLMNNQHNRDLLMLPYLKDYLKRGYTDEFVENTFKRKRV